MREVQTVCKTYHVEAENREDAIEAVKCGKGELVDTRGVDGFHEAELWNIIGEEEEKQ